MRHEVALIARLPDNTPPLVNQVHHYPIETIKNQDFFQAQTFDAIVVCNAPIACPYLKLLNPKANLIFWDHVPPDQPSMNQFSNPDIRAAIDTIVYVSAWQKVETEKKFGLQEKAVVIGNGLTPTFENMFSSPKDLLKIKENRAAYTTIPYRGLPILLKAFEGLDDAIELDIFSSMRVYQQDDKEYDDLYKHAVKDKRIHYYGSVSQKELAEKLKPAAFLTYPSICAETFCIGALEAMAAGMKVITTKLGALETTTMGYADLVSVESSNAEDLVRPYRSTLKKNIDEFLKSPESWADKMFEQVRTVNQTSTWNMRSKDWEKLFKN